MCFLLRYNILDFFVAFIYYPFFFCLFLVSSFLEFPIPKGIAFIAEIGLSGELRMVSMFTLILNVATCYCDI